MAATEVRLVGEGGVEWTFELPLSEPFADQVKAHTLRPADDESAAGVADILASAAESEVPKELTLAEQVNAVSSHEEANALAAVLGVEGFEDKKPALGAKRDALKAAVAALAAA